MGMYSRPRKHWARWQVHKSRPDTQSLACTQYSTVLCLAVHHKAHLPACCLLECI